MEGRYKDLSLVLATIAGFLMIATAMFFAMVNTGVINNNNIGIENAKARLIYNISLQSDSELNQLVINNNLIAERYSNLTLVFFTISLILGIISIFLSLPRKPN